MPVIFSAKKDKKYRGQNGQVWLDNTCNQLTSPERGVWESQNHVALSSTHPSQRGCLLSSGTQAFPISWQIKHLTNFLVNNERSTWFVSYEPPHCYHLGLDKSVLGACAVHCRMFISFPGLFPLDASRIYSPRCDSQNCLLTFPNVCWRWGEQGWGQNCPNLRTTIRRNQNHIKSLHLLGIFYIQSSLLFSYIKPQNSQKKYRYNYSHLKDEEIGGEKGFIN